MPARNTCRNLEENDIGDRRVIDRVGEKGSGRRAELGGTVFSEFSTPATLLREGESFVEPPPGAEQRAARERGQTPILHGGLLEAALL